MSVSARLRKRALKVSIQYPSWGQSKLMVQYLVYVRGRRVDWGERYRSSEEVLHIEMKAIGCTLRAGRWIADCRRCEKDIDIQDYCSPQEWLEQDRYNDLCGGQWCMP